MDRAFEVPNGDKVGLALMRAWRLAAPPMPVNTDYPANGKKPKLVLVLESPTPAEVRDGMPCVGKTGENLCKTLWGFGVPNCTRNQLSEHGVYLTNLVRYAANGGVTAPRGTGRKLVDLKLELACNIAGVRKQITQELMAVCEKWRCRDIPLVFASGKSGVVHAAIWETTQAIGFPFCRWLHTCHPSSGPHWERVATILKNPLPTSEAWGVESIYGMSPLMRDEQVRSLNLLSPPAA